MTTKLTSRSDSSPLFSHDSGPVIHTTAPISHTEVSGIEHTNEEKSEKVLSTRAATATEASGRRLLTRAALTAGFGGGVIAFTSMAFGPRFLASDVRVLGIFVGLLIVGLAMVCPLHPTAPKSGLGVLIVAGAIAAFPIAAGGYFIGSIAAIIGGSLLVAYEPPPEEVHVLVYRAGRIRRLVGLMVDFILAFAVQRLIIFAVPAIGNVATYTYLSWVLAWFAAAVVPTVLTRRTGGRILVVLRVADQRSGQRSSTLKSLIRELLRGTIVIISFFALAAATLGTTLRYAPSLGMIAILAITGFVGERFFILDRLTGTASVYDDIVPGPENDNRAK